MVSAVDDGVGVLLDKLEELEIQENTMIFFLSDNGGPYKSNGSINLPLREGKGSLYEGGIRVPFAMQWPRKIPSDQVFDAPVISLDIFATVAEYAGTKPVNALDGVNIVPYLLGQEQGVPHENLFWRIFDSDSYAVRSGDMKLVNMNGIQDELYNLTEDIGEKHEMDSEEEMQRLIIENKRWESMMMDPVFLGLKQNDEYNELHPRRFETEPY